MSLSECYLGDISLSQRKSGFEVEIDLDHLCSDAMERAAAAQLIYTAFDGDHQQLRSYMRRVVLARGHVPVNPDSVLGYKDTVMARLDKRGVLLDDLAVLRGCDQLWVFTEAAARAECVREMAEGVVIELLFFLKRFPGRQVSFVSPSSLVSSESPMLVGFEPDFREVSAALLPSQMEALKLADSGDETDKQLPAVQYYICDPLDFKYAYWLREHGYRDRIAPLVPYLAIELGDCGAGLRCLEETLVGWVRLARLATKAVVLPPLDRRLRSRTAQLLEKAWLRGPSGTSLTQGSWQDYQVPKAKSRRRWSITSREAEGDST